MICNYCGSVEVEEKVADHFSLRNTPRRKESFGDRLLNEMHAVTRLLFPLYIFYALVYSLFSACNLLINFQILFVVRLMAEQAEAGFSFPLGMLAHSAHSGYA